jgi:hypothetical protein
MQHLEIERQCNWHKWIPFQTQNLLQMSCNPLSTKMTQRTFHFWWNNEGHEMMESDNGNVMTNKSYQILQWWRACVWDLPDFHPDLRPPSLGHDLKFRRSHTHALLLYLQTKFGSTKPISYSKNTWELVALKLTQKTLL